MNKATGTVQIDQKSLSTAIRKFSFWLANGTVDYVNMKDISYKDQIMDEPSALEMIYAIFINNLKFDENGQVENAKYAESRSGIFIRQYFNGDHSENLDSWEMELY